MVYNLFGAQTSSCHSRYYCAILSMSRRTPRAEELSSWDLGTCEAASFSTLTCPLRQTLGAKAAAALDQELMSTCAFSLDQLMELAGLSVSQAGEMSNPMCDGRIWTRHWV